MSDLLPSIYGHSTLIRENPDGPDDFDLSFRYCNSTPWHRLDLVLEKAAQKALRNLQNYS